MDERSPFCPSCGTAQIRVSPREPSSETLVGPADSANDPTASRNPEGYSSAMVPGSPSTIQWQKYFKVSWPLALAAGLASGVFPPGGFLLFIPLAVIFSLRLYRKHHFGQIRAGQGALLGAALSLLSFVVIAGIFAFYYSHNNAQIKDSLTRAVNDAVARNPNPDAAQALHSLADSPEGMLALFSFIAFILFCINTVFACLAGALAANFGQDKPRP
jgi:hypothetical protein